MKTYQVIVNKTDIIGETKMSNSACIIVYATTEQGASDTAANYMNKTCGHYEGFQITSIQVKEANERIFTFVNAALIADEQTSNLEENNA